MLSAECYAALWCRMSVVSKGAVVGMKCLGRNMCLPSPSQIGSCHVTGESWLVGWELMTKLGINLEGGKNNKDA